MFAQGMTFGLSAALTFGLSDFLSALVSRQIGPLYTLLGVQIVGIVLLLGYFLRGGEALSLLIGTLPMLLLIGIGLGMLDVLAYLSFYIGLSIGPVALVSPIVSSSGIVTVVLAIMMLGESTTLWQAVGMCLTLGGVIVSSVDISMVVKKLRQSRLASFVWWKSYLAGKWETRARWRSGCFFGVLSMFGFGLFLFLLSRWTRVVDPIISIFLIRLVSAIALAIFAWYRRETLPKYLPVKSLGGISLIGVFDTIGLLTYSAGTTKALTSVVTALVSSYSLIPVFLSILLLRERVTRTQIGGIVAILSGMCLLALGK